MKDIIISVSKDTKQITKMSQVKIANDGENYQAKLIFNFSDEFVNGTARLEYTMQNDSNKYYQILTKNEEAYEIPVKSVITKEGRLYMQLVITQAEVDEEIPIFKSNVFYVYVDESINAETEEPSEYPTWLEIANSKLAEIDDALDEVANFDITANKIGNITTVTITDRDGVEHTTEILDGVDGLPGRDGVDGQPGPANTLTIGTVEKGENPEATITGTSPNQVLNLVLPKGDPGSAGQNGADGYSPVATVTKSGNTATISITDKNGTTTAQVSDGVSGRDGQNGRDGYVQYTAGANITIENNVISATGGSAGNVDGVTTRLNTDDEIEVMGIYTEQNSARKIWEGTLAQYNALQNKDSDTYYYIIDDNVSPNEVPNGGTTGQVLGKASNTDNDTTWLDKRNPVNVTTSNDSTYTISSLIGNQSYKLGTLTSLIINAVSLFDEESIIYFTSGSTATTITVPTTLVNIGDVPELTSGTGTCTASKSYIIAILNNIAVWKEY